MKVTLQMACTPRPAPFKTDEDLIGYCELHCRTPVALFTREQVARVAALAGKQLDVGVSAWISVHEDTMLPLVEAARRRLRG